MSALRGWNAITDQEGDDQPLISSGRLDSSALFELSLWIEQRLGRPLDPAKFKVAQDWNTPNAILAFIRKHADAPPATHVVSVPPVQAARSHVRSEPEDAFEVVAYQDNHRSAVLELQKQLWSTDDSKNAEFLDWRYFRNPVSAAPLLCLVLHRGRPVAMRGAFASRWQVGRDSADFVWYQSDDLVVLPEFQSRGIFAILNAYLQQHLEAHGQRFFLSLSALRITRMQSLAAGAHSIGAMEPFGRLSAGASAMDGLRALARKMPLAWRLADFWVPAEKAIRAFDRLAAAKPERIGAWRLAGDSVVRATDMAALVASLEYDGRIRQRRDADYFAWRFLNPLHQYRLIYAESDSRLAGYLVLERSLSDRSNPRRINIADWEAESPELAAELLRFAVSWGDFPEIVTWTRTSGQTRLSVLRASGFAPIDHEQTARGLPSVLLWPIRDSQPIADFTVEGQSLLDLANWDLRMSDTSLA